MDLLHVDTIVLVFYRLSKVKMPSQFCSTAQSMKQHKISRQTCSHEGVCVDLCVWLDVAVLFDVWAVDVVQWLFCTRHSRRSTHVLTNTIGCIRYHNPWTKARPSGCQESNDALSESSRRHGSSAAISAPL